MGAPVNEDELKEISLSKIVVNPYQPRREFKPHELEELAASIRSVGLLHPPLVRFLEDQEVYELIAGERRFRAAQLANCLTIPVYIRHAENALSAQAALIENIQRVDLNPWEISRALHDLMKDFGFTQEQLAQKIGIKRSTLANYLRLLTLPESIQNSVRKGCITMGHAKAILSVNQKEKQLLLHELILRDDLTVRKAEAAAHLIEKKKTRKQELIVPRDFHMNELLNRMREKLGTQVSIHPKGEQGSITIEYYGNEDLERLIEILGIQLD
jgi:ParB family chromosome partitioning protein